MLRIQIMTLAVLLPSLRGAAQSEQTINWAKLFEGATAHDRRSNDNVRTLMTEDILPKLLKEDPETVKVEVGGLLAQLDRKEGEIRLQASAVLVVLSQYRQDSAMVLAPAASAMMDHVHDPLLRVSMNSLNALASLTPEIPDQELNFLIQLSEDANQGLVEIATHGVARMAGSRSDAWNCLARMLSSGDSNRKIIAIRTLGTTHVNDIGLVKTLGNALSDKNRSVVKAALQSISDLGKSAIKPNLAEIGRVANSEDVELASRARELQDREQLPQ